MSYSPETRAYVNSLHPDSATKSAGALGKAFQIAMGGLGGYMAVNDGGAAIDDFRQGNYGSGLANLGVAALGAAGLGSSAGKLIKGTRGMRRNMRNVAKQQKILQRGGRQNSSFLGFKPIRNTVNKIDSTRRGSRLLDKIESFSDTKGMLFLNNPRKGHGMASMGAQMGAYMGLGALGDKLRNPGTINPYTDEVVPRAALRSYRPAVSMANQARRSNPYA